MSDIGTALRKALSEWDTAPPTTVAPAQPEPIPYFTTTNNVCRTTFEYIRDNPGKHRKEVCSALLAQGYKVSSTTTLIGQMVKQYHVRESQGLLYATSDTYVPLKGSKAWAKIQGMAQRKKVTIVSKRTGEVFSRPVQEAPQITSTWNVTDQLNNMSIVQARLMYDALRKIFGG